MSTDELYRVAMLCAVIVIAFSLYTIASIGAYDFVERRYLPPKGAGRDD